MEPKDYWRIVCAPVVRSKKQQIGRKLSNSDIASAIERATGKDTSRQLVEHWFRGIREPYLSQFIALCGRLELNPVDVMAPTQSVKNITQKRAEGTLLYSSKHHRSAASDEKKRRKTER